LHRADAERRVTSKTFRQRLVERAAHAGVAIAPDMVDRLETYLLLLARWNERVNLTALPVDVPTDQTIDRLLIEPLAAARYVDKTWSPWFDVGSGGGSPAIPLKLAKPHLHLTMVESKARKAAFLREAVRELVLADSTVETARFEDLALRRDIAGTRRLVTVRAVRLDNRMALAAARVLAAGGHLLAFSTTPTFGPLDGFEVHTTTKLISSPIGSTSVVDFLRCST